MFAVTSDAGKLIKFV